MGLCVFGFASFPCLQRFAVCGAFALVGHRNFLVRLTEWQKLRNTTEMVVSVFLGVYGKTIDLCDTEEQFKSITVLQLKEKIIETIRPENVSVAAEALELIFKDKLLDRNSALLSEYGIQHMSVIPVFFLKPTLDMSVPYWDAF
uniref:Ubiquitin-like domain-containing protein n=1 Tax=Dicentrarchus labrax TaxID=13489 RepID=A0A8C4E6C8_DICLA